MANPGKAGAIAQGASASAGALFFMTLPESYSVQLEGCATF